MISEQASQLYDLQNKLYYINKRDDVSSKIILHVCPVWFPISQDIFSFNIFCEKFGDISRPIRIIKSGTYDDILRFMQQLNESKISDILLSFEKDFVGPVKTVTIDSQLVKYNFETDLSGVHKINNGFLNRLAVGFKLLFCGKLNYKLKSLYYGRNLVNKTLTIS